MRYRKALCGVLCAMAMFLTACSSSTEPATPTDATTTQVEITTTTAAETEEAPPMMFDLENHWNEGEPPAKHQTDADGVCETCGVLIENDGEQTLVSQSDGVGNLLKVLVYEGKVLVDESIYTYYEGLQATYCAKNVTYYESGAVSGLTETDESGNNVFTQYDEQGNVTEVVDTTFDENGNMISVIRDAQQQVTEKVIVEYDGLGNSYTSIFDGADRLISSEEVIYDENLNFTDIFVFYNEDGSVSYKEVWESGENGQTKTVYDANGNVIETEAY